MYASFIQNLELNLLSTVQLIPQHTTLKATLKKTTAQPGAKFDPDKVLYTIMTLSE